MIKVSIDKELNKVSSKEREIYKSDPVNEVKLLLNGDETEDNRILRNLSKHSQISRVEDLLGEKIELENLETSYDGKVYTKEQIKKLAVDYKLRFLKSENYSGNFDVQVAAKIKEFSKKTKSPIDGWSLSNKYYILAPETMFTLKDKRYVTKRELDPAIFYQVDENHYRLIHKWGSDFTIFRYLTGFRWKSYGNYWLFNTMMILPVVALIMTLLCDVSFVLNSPIFFSFCTLALSFVLSLLFKGLGKLDEFSAIKGFFTPHNWDSTERLHR